MTTDDTPSRTNSSTVDDQVLAWLGTHEPHGPIARWIIAWDRRLRRLRCQSCGAQIEPEGAHFYDIPKTWERLDADENRLTTMVSDLPGEEDCVVPNEDCYPVGDKAYLERVRRGIYAMFSREGDAAVAAVVAAVRAQMADGQLATPVDVREALHERMWEVEERFAEKADSEVWLSLTYAFEDIIPEGVTWPRGWLEHELTTYLYVSAYSDGEFLSFEHTILEATSTDEAYAAGQELLMGHETHRVNDYVIDVGTLQD